LFNDRYLQGDLPSMFKELIVSIQYLQDWNSEIENSSRATTYNIVL